jgi:O-antigen/teichoic acid export membrane protein
MAVKVGSGVRTEGSVENRFPSSNLRALFVQGGTSLAAVAVLQRACGFVAAALAARIGGPSVFGTYSAVLATAGMVAGYAGLGVGATASRFLGRYRRNTWAYRKTLWLIVAIAACSSILAAVILLGGAAPVARLALGNEALAQPLRIAAVLASAFVLYEALNGIAMGLLSFSTLLWLSGVSGIGMVVALSYSARLGADAMLLGHAGALGVAILVTLVRRYSSINSLPGENTMDAEAPRSREVVVFGATQVMAMAGISCASWWVVVLISRYDPLLGEMGQYGVGNQLRQVVAVAGGLASQLVFPLLARFKQVPGGDARVVSASTFLCTTMSLLLGGILLLVLPIILRLYGPAYDHAATIAALLIATAVVQMSGVPASQYLMTIHLRGAGLINLFFAASLGVLAFWLVPSYGAVGAASAWLLAQIGAQIIVYTSLRQMGRLPHGVANMWWLATSAALVLAGTAWLRAVYPDREGAVTIIAGSLLVVLLVILLKVAQGRGYLPREAKAMLAALRTVPPIVIEGMERSERV